MVNVLLTISVILNVVLSILLAVFIKKYRRSENLHRINRICMHR